MHIFTSFSDKENAPDDFENRQAYFSALILYLFLCGMPQ
mgnify:CR=1 FL=1